MKHELVTYPGFSIVGIETQIPCGNSPEEMGALWQRFFQENIWEQIPNKANSEIICMYTDYESDFNGPMTVILGAKVNSIRDIPEELVSRTISSARYTRFTGKGALPDVVVQTWQTIWSSDLDRAYTQDFEVYAHNQNPKNAKIDVYIAV